MLVGLVKGCKAYGFPNCCLTKNNAVSLCDDLEDGTYERCPFLSTKRSSSKTPLDTPPGSTVSIILQ